MGFRQMGEYSWIQWNVWHSCIQGWEIHTCRKLCVPLHIPACLCISLSHTRKSLTPLYTKHRQSWQGARIHCVTQWDSALASLLKAMGTVYWTQSKLSYLTTYLTSPYTWVRKPDCPNLTYKGVENLFEKLMIKTFLIWWKKKTQFQETQRVSIKRNPKRPTSTHIIIKMAKFKKKEKILQAAREKQEVIYKVAPDKASSWHLIRNTTS